MPQLKVAEVARNIQIGRYITTAVYALQIYEWLISLDDEWILIHRARWSSVKFAFLWCRYYPILVWPIYMWAFVGNHKRDVCSNIIHPLYFFMIPFQLSSQGVMIIRSWAFTGRKRIILCILLSAYATLIAMEIWAFATDVDVARSPTTKIGGKMGCIRARGSGPVIVADRLAILFVSACFVDFLCMLIITVHCVRLRSLQGTLGKMFVAQGFGAFFVMTIVHIAAATVSFRNTVRFAGGSILPIPLILSNIIACRLILSLRRKASPTQTEEDIEISRIVRDAMAQSPDHWVC